MNVWIVTPNPFNQIDGGGVLLTNLFKDCSFDLTNIYWNDTIPDRTVCADFLHFDRDWLEISDRLMRPECKPDVIYTWPSPHVRQMEFIQQLVISWPKIHLVIHMMDDWPAVTNRLLHFKAFRLFHWMLKHAILRLAISEWMAKAYMERYRRHFYTFHNIAERIKHIEPAVPYPHKPVLSYLGSLIPGIQREAIAEATYIAAWQGYEIRTASRVGHFRSYLEDNGALLLAYNRNAAKQVNLSSPAKLPAYLASGRPMIYYGPKIGLTEWMVSQNLEAIAHSPNELREMLKHLPSRGKRWAEKQERIALDEFSIKHRERFQHMLGGLNSCQ